MMAIRYYPLILMAAVAFVPAICLASDYDYKLTGVKTGQVGSIDGTFTIHIDDSGFPSITRYDLKTKKVFSKDFQIRSKHCKYCSSKISVGSGSEGQYDQGIGFQQLLPPYSGQTYNIIQFNFTFDESQAWGGGAASVSFVLSGSTNPPPSSACATNCGSSGLGYAELTAGTLTLVGSPH